MTINEAIKILTLMGKPEFEGHTEDILAARKLGIEALKRIKELRPNYSYARATRLPGETKEFIYSFKGGEL